MSESLFVTSVSRGLRELGVVTAVDDSEREGPRLGGGSHRRCLKGEVQVQPCSG